MEMIIFLKENSEVITALTAIGALLISTLAIIRATQDNRKQIIVGKIEEIYELIVYLIVEYKRLYELSILLEECGDENDKNYTEAFSNYKIELKKLKEDIDLNDLFNKIIRLNVLSNSYLNKDLKLEVLAVGGLFECLIATLQLKNLTRKRLEYNEGFPTTENIRNLVGHVLTKLTNKISLGADNQGVKVSKNYRETVFKQKLGLRE
jgi:hypothetical protein